ncbi:MAG: AtpZ/AtpI family protein [Actinobacteria bacterium]|nr:AtpZ/AtpI family protein [Actinomycetota bacterium]
MPDDPDGQSLGWSDLLGLGIVIAAQLVAGLGLGWLVDDLAGTSPIFLLIGLLLGLAGAVSYTVVKFREYLKT